MTDSVLQKYTRSGPEAAAASQEPDATDDLGAFGWLRGVRDRAIMLELRQANGNVIALGYAWLERAEFDPSEGITLQFGGKSVRIVGRNLHGENRPEFSLYAGIVRHRVPWIQEADRTSALESAHDATVIEELEIKA